MKTSFSVAFGLGLALVAPLVTGCAAEDEEAAGAAYPATPVGYDLPADSSQNPVASSNTPPPPPVPSSPPASDGAPSDPQAQPEDLQAQPNDVAIGADPNDYEDTDPSALTDFHSTLDPYGSWVDDPNYGTVWTPSEDVVGSDFSPYVSNGSWSYDDSGDYVWNSGYDWGWAPFHYGRWAYLGTGWGWIPGRRYAGAWVSWRTGGGYLGWAPLPPTYYWRGGYAFGVGAVPYAPYAFCGVHDVFRPGFGGRLVTNGPQAAGIAQRTQPYTPASPTVGGAGRTTAHPVVGGPAPGSVGIAPNEVAHASAANPGLAHALAFAHPASAQALGAHAPSISAARAANMAASRPSSSSSMASRMPAYGRNTAVASAPRYQGIAPAPYHSPSYSPRYGSPYGGSGYGSGRAYGSYPSYGSPRGGSPYYSSGRMGPYYGGAARGGGAYHPSSGGGSHGAPEPEGYGTSSHHGGGGFRGGGGFHGGGGGGHGGGGHR
jgi:hypothetical protein